MDNIFGDFLKGRGFSFRQYGRDGGASRIIFNVPEDENIQNYYTQGQRARARTRPQSSAVNYEITITGEQAEKGMEKDLVRKGKRLRVKIPAGIKSGARIRLRNARLTTDGLPGDIYIKILVKNHA
ncbi:MAG: DnaJ C-terminal domain-containing protein [Dehalococcoidales bacterium]|nr:DnaJ C-terminal domain-containing protein [Dehalococcoidales bacterium]